MTDSTALLSDAGSLLDGEPIAETAPAERRTRQARVAWGTPRRDRGRRRAGARAVDDQHRHR